MTLDDEVVVVLDDVLPASVSVAEDDAVVVVDVDVLVVASANCNSACDWVTPTASMAAAASHSVLVATIVREAEGKRGRRTTIPFPFRFCVGGAAPRTSYSAMAAKEPAGNQFPQSFASPTLFHLSPFLAGDCSIVRIINTELISVHLGDEQSEHTIYRFD